MKTVVLLAMASILSNGPLSAQTHANSPEAATAPATNSLLPKGNGKISGFVSEEAAKTPVAIATVPLVDKTTGKTVDGAITDDKGKFTINRVANGHYTLTITFLGYEAKVINNLTVGSKDEVKVGPIALKANTK